MVIGRAAGTDLRVNDDGVSRFHCKLHRNANGIVVEDLHSRNGTFCNGERVLPGARPLKEGDRLQIGTTFVLRFTYEPGDDRISSPVLQGETTDKITGAHSRRHFVDVLDRELATALANTFPLSLILIHIDRYSDLVDSMGQDLVDPIVAIVVDEIRARIDPGVIIGRIAGGDFGLLLSRRTPGDTFMLAERLRQSTKTLATKITLSLGVAALDELRIETTHDLLVAAGSAIHRARSQGGNRVVFCTPDLLREPKIQTRV
jgi:diguanylate cyclase (GGDEF)-like protein